MQSLTKVICSSLLIGFSATCWAAKPDPIRLTSKSLEIKADITHKFRNFDNGKSKIEGKITITNLTSIPQKYGNKFLQLIVNGRFPSRTYKDTIASEVIDFTVIEIKPHSSLSQSVYWVFDVPSENEVDSLRLSIDEEGIAKAEGITRP